MSLPHSSFKYQRRTDGWHFYCVFKASSCWLWFCVNSLWRELGIWFSLSCFRYRLGLQFSIVTLFTQKKGLPSEFHLPFVALHLLILWISSLIQTEFLIRKNNGYTQRIMVASEQNQTAACNKVNCYLVSSLILGHIWNWRGPRFKRVWGFINRKHLYFDSTCLFAIASSTPWPKGCVPVKREGQGWQW